MSRKLEVIVAVCDGMGIGIDGRMPWKLKGDMKFFREQTSRTTEFGKRNAVIMGRKTWLSIPPKLKPLRGRLNVVLSSDPSFSVHVSSEVMVAMSLDEAIYRLEQMEKEIERIFVIGGASLYKEALSSRRCERIFLTRIFASFPCDTFFPPLPISCTPDLALSFYLSPSPSEEDGVKYQHEVYTVNTYLEQGDISADRKVY